MNTDQGVRQSLGAVVRMPTKLAATLGFLRRQADGYYDKNGVKAEGETVKVRLRDGVIQA